MHHRALIVCLTVTFVVVSLLAAPAVRAAPATQSEPNPMVG